MDFLKLISGRLVYNEKHIISDIAFHLDESFEYISQLVELARPYYKEDGYHNFIHAMQTAAYCAKHTPNLNMVYAMLFHDAHWSKTDDRHNVVASMYRAVKVNLDNDLCMDNKEVCEYIASTTFVNGEFLQPMNATHRADLMSGLYYDTWGSQWSGLCSELGLTPNLESLTENFNFFLTKTKLHTFDVNVYVSRIGPVLAQMELDEILRKQHRFIQHNGFTPNAIFLNPLRYKRIKDWLIANNDDLKEYTGNDIRLYGMKVMIVLDDIFKLGYVYD